MTEPTTTPDRTVLTDKILSQAAFTATIDAPIGKIDIAGWLRTMPDREYHRCAPPDHKAAGYTTTDDRRPMSIADVLTPSGRTTVQVIWGLKADPVDDKTSKYTNTVTTHPTAELIDFIARHGQTFV